MLRKRVKTTLFWVPIAILVLGSCESSSQFSSYQNGEELPGGSTTNTLLFGSNAFTLPVENISVENEPLFFSGNGFFNQPWVEAPASTESRDGLGPLFNARSCAACHFKDGRGAPPLTPEESFVALLLRLSVPGTDEHGGPLPDPSYGGQLQPFSNPGVPTEGTPLLRTSVVTGQFSDGTSYDLLEPSYSVAELAYGPLSDDILISPRVAPAMVGLGLLEAIPASALESLADPNDNDGDGISGRVNRVWDVERQTRVVGRFGWKAEQPTIKQQSAGAFLGDIGITTSLFQSQSCTSAQVDCNSAISGGAPELSNELLQRVDVYSRLLAVPARDRFKGEDVLRGKALFYEIGCAACHTPNHETGESDLIELENQSIWPYTDLLLHDMGPELADNRPVFDASGSEWRTPPLWGLRFYTTVNGHNRLLHDGRARGVTEAILWHGGEASQSKTVFKELEKSDRNSLVHFVESL